MATLLTSSSSDEEEEPQPSTSGGLKINQDYATSYNRFREKEVFQRLKDKYGEEAAQARMDDDLGQGDSSSSSEDEGAEALTEEIEKDFFKTLACLKKKDPRIYDGRTEFFKETAAKKKGKEKKERPMYLGDLERKVMLEKEGKYDELEDEELARKSTNAGRTYVQELDEIKKSFKAAVAEEEEEEDMGLLKPKKKSRREAAKEEMDYKSWLSGQKEEVEDEETKKDLGGLRDFWNKKDLDEGEKFLKDYILNRRFVDSSDAQEAHGDSDEEDLSEDEKTVERMEEFEHKYNFRFEEPDPEFIRRYPRTVPESMRREDNKRKKKRDEVQDRKQREKEKKQEELKQLKALKKKEILEKLEKLKKVSGCRDLAFGDEDIEGDFDPSTYDKRMAELFGKYDEAHVEDEDEKPDISDLLESDLEEELEVENWDEWEGPAEDGDVEDPNFVMDCDYEENVKLRMQQELIDSSRGGKRRRKSKFAEALEKKKPVFDPNDKTFEQYLDEYYKLDYEDIVGGMPCRFKYRQVEQNDFGLDTGEILSAPDRELNAWCSLKKTCQYRSEEEEKADVRLFKGRGHNWSLKRKFIPSLFADNPEQELEAEKGKKSRKKRKKTEEAEEGETEEKPTLSVSAEKKGKKGKSKAENPLTPEKKTKKKESIIIPQKRGRAEKNNLVNADIKMSDDRLKAYGLNPNQLKRKVKKQKYKQKKD